MGGDAHSIEDGAGSVRILKKLWQGDYPLMQSFWGFYVFGCLVVPLFAILVSAAFILIGAPPFAAITFATIFFDYFAIASVGVWQSATKYPYTRWWPGCAKVIVALLVRI